MVSPFQIKNIRLFIAFRICFNARFYYPVFTVLFLDFGLTLDQFALLNAVWAASIVLLEVPLGAIADGLSRKTLVRIASIIMVVEVGLLCFCPIGLHPWVFYIFLINRILSGAAEAAASGADEALAYDSLIQVGLKEQWSSVLEKLMRYQSMAFVFAMIMGGLLYDAEFLNKCFSSIGLGWSLSSEETLRIPLLLTWVLGVGALCIAFSMDEVEEGRHSQRSVSQSFKNIIQSALWIIKTPLAFSFIIVGCLLDHVIRMILTLNSEYLRQIEYPEATFGIVFAASSSLGMVIPKLSKWLVNHYSGKVNFSILLLIVSLGLLARVIR